MSGYNDGSSFGYDEINPYDHIPISFEQTKISGRPMLLARGEYPRFSASQTVNQLDEISQKTLTKRVDAPRGMIEGFSATPKFSLGLTAEDQQTLLIFLLALVVVMQVRIMMQLDHPDRHYAVVREVPVHLP